MNDDLRNAALRAGLWQVIQQRAEELKNEAKAELAQALEPGDSIAGKHGDQTVCKVTAAKGRAKLVVTDETKLVGWAALNHPSEIVRSVNPAYLKSLEAKAREIGTGAVIDKQGDVIPGIELVEGEPYVSVRRTPEAAFVVAQLLSGGQLSLDGVKELEA
jgi:hypothetical protein